MESLGVSSVQNLQALSKLLSCQQEEEDDEDCKVRFTHPNRTMYEYQINFILFT